jgi:EmrB/QacA subfamily drug resistance transporter
MAGNRRRWLILGTMALPMVLLSIDFYGIAVALPVIGIDLHTTTTGLQWTISGFNLAVAAPLIAFGRLGDLIGRRRMLLMGIVLFAIGSAVCGAAPGIGVLILGRCMQGLAVALFSTSPLSIVSLQFPAGERGLAFGIWTAVGAGGAAMGPLAGGLLTQYLSWRWFFFINIPVALLTIALILAVVPESSDDSADGHLDVLGVVTVTAGLAAFVFGLQLGDDWGWTSPTVIAGLVSGFLLLVAFVVVEARQRHPLIDLRLFRRNDFVRAQLVALSGNFGFNAVIFFTTLYLQKVLDLQPIEAGLVLAVFSACFVLTLPSVGRVLPRLGDRRSMALGMALMVLACLLFQPLAVHDGLFWLTAALAVAGIGQGFAFNASTTATMNAVPDTLAGAASGILNGARQVGSTLGIAVTGAVFQSIESATLLDVLARYRALDDDQQERARSVLSGSIDAEDTIIALAQHAAPALGGIVDDAFVAALHGGMLLCAIVSMLGLLACLPAGGVFARAAWTRLSTARR